MNLFNIIKKHKTEQKQEFIDEDLSVEEIRGKITYNMDYTELERYKKRLSSQKRYQLINYMLLNPLHLKKTANFNINYDGEHPSCCCD